MEPSRLAKSVTPLGTGVTRRGVLGAAGALALLGDRCLGTRPLPGPKPKRPRRPKRKRCSRQPLGAYCLDHADCCSGICARFNICAASFGEAAAGAGGRQQ